MSAKSLKKTGDNLTEAAIDLLWKQWRAIGAGATGRAATAQVDPEALILATLALYRREKRLRVVMADWLAEGARFISTQRLRNLVPTFDQTVQSELSRLAAQTVKASKDGRWRSLRSPDSDDAKDVVNEKRRMRSVELVAPPALVLRLRAAFGVGVKADLTAFLLGQEYRTTVTVTAESLGCSTPTAFRALQDLVAAGFVRTVDTTAAAEYYIATEAWSDLLGKESRGVPWRWWAELLLYLLDVLNATEVLSRSTTTEYVIGVKLREIGERHNRALLRARFLGQRRSLPESASVADWAEFHHDLARWIAESA